ncbi:MAG: class I SAM-dependent methyltransferase [Desulfobacteraceae bacterium]|nr:class I SAM-dependent methyltransferase [Desulfobacteraceae bacterium]
MASFNAPHSRLDDSAYSGRLAKKYADPPQKIPTPSYLMESPEETVRLEMKTDPEVVRQQAKWCGVKPGLRVLDVGCGPGKTSSILYEMIMPGGELVGLDFSEERIYRARQQYGGKPGLQFLVSDYTAPLDGLGNFDLIWARFVLEHNLLESPAIVENLTACLRPGGYLCLLDLDHNCLNHYGLPPAMERVLFQIMAVLEDKYNFDPYAGRKLYAYLYDLGYREIQVDLMAHHLIYGKTSEVDVFNWTKKTEIVLRKAPGIFDSYQGGQAGFFSDFIQFFNDSRRFTYTPLILCKGKKPHSIQPLKSYTRKGN